MFPCTANIITIIHLIFPCGLNSACGSDGAMFARHTRTRMRPSSIAQGLKSWASKLHPQLPLTNQESSRLLNALTSAFRQKLDEAHPSNTKDHPKQDLSSKTVQKSASAFHSSAAHADKHLETVLTNPLLGGRILDYGTAKVELTRNPHRDPIEVLERYHEQGAASVAIAELVLSHFKHSLERLSQSKQDSLIEKTQAGRRVFKWLLESNLYDSKSYVDNLMFIEHLVFFLVKEGREANIWSWVKLDIGNLDDAPVNAARSIEKATRKTNLYKYRWRGRVLRALVSTKMGLLHAAGRSPSPEEINDGFDTISKICELKRSVAQSDHLYWIPMAPISTLLGRILARDMHRIRSELEVTKFDTLYDFMPVICDQAPPILLELERAKLLMIHPKVSCNSRNHPRESHAPRFTNPKAQQSAPRYVLTCSAL